MTVPRGCRRAGRSAPGPAPHERQRGQVPGVSGRVDLTGWLPEPPPGRSTSPPTTASPSAVRATPSANSPRGGDGTGVAGGAGAGDEEGHRDPTKAEPAEEEPAAGGGPAAGPDEQGDEDGPDGDEHPGGEGHRGEGGDISGSWAAVGHPGAGVGPQRLPGALTEQPARRWKPNCLPAAIHDRRYPHPPTSPALVAPAADLPGRRSSSRLDRLTAAPTPDNS